MAELKPCPFCGAKAELAWSYCNGKRYYIPKCTNRFCCGRLTTKRFLYENKTIEMWNRRADNG